MLVKKSPVFNQFSIRLFSFVGRRPIVLEPGVTLSLQAIQRDPKIRDYTHKTTPFMQQIAIEGPLGRQEFKLADGLLLSKIDSKEPENSTFVISVDQLKFSHYNRYQQKFIKSMWGLTATLLSNMALGVKEGYYCIVRLVGVGYKAMLDETETNLLLKVGFSHTVTVPIPITIKKVQILANQTKISIFGIDKQQVTQFAHSLRRIRKPNVYTGKGIYVDDETIIRKVPTKR